MRVFAIFLIIAGLAIFILSTTGGPAGWSVGIPICLAMLAYAGIMYGFGEIIAQLKATKA